MEFVYHLKVFALGIPFAGLVAALAYLLVHAPIWAVLVLLGIPAIYCFGKATEIFIALARETSDGR